MADEVKLNDIDLESVEGGAGPWQNYAKGTYVNYGNYVIYTVASGDVLTGRCAGENGYLGLRFASGTTLRMQTAFMLAST